MHISSLPSEFGIGKLGDSAYMFANLFPSTPEILISLISSGWKSRAIWHRRITRTLSGAKTRVG